MARPEAFPVGYEEFDGGLVLIDETGRFFLMHHTGPYFLGMNAYEAIACLVRGGQADAEGYSVRRGPGDGTPGSRGGGRAAPRRQEAGRCCPRRQALHRG
ncbi:SUKH-3 domain-containing protein [Streptomyces sp. NPDC003036]|uniref:SUKH-3 domain-containing protein n=1 Tax=Streptomyces sp. NPDC003036 TaxID=3154442 RepID=UPI0033B007BE